MSTLSPPNRACLARQEVDARPRLLCSRCTMPRPRCLVILLPQGDGRDFRFGENARLACWLEQSKRSSLGARLSM